ncbi:putative helicase MOV-10 isoform X2 [Varroa destructor]|uniref:RNA helicase n=1 Tax=Varroa destructor TaxID=109461 RepID=A0A7M7M693_VARDE|nr:putative helicase MOV-10 isoform X2 [Varroa destructor]
MLKSRQTVRCEYCGVNVLPTDRDRHVKSLSHEIGLIKHYLSSKRAELTREKEGLSTWLDGQKTGDVIFIESEPGEPTTVDLEVCSKDYDIQLNKAFILEASEILQVKIKDSAKIPKGGSCFVTLVAYSVDVASKTVTLALILGREGNPVVRLVRHIRVRCGNERVRNIESNNTPFTETKPVLLPTATKIIKMTRATFSQKIPAQALPRRRDAGFVNEDEEYDDQIPLTTIRRVPLDLYFADNYLRQLHLAQMQVDDKSDPNLVEYYKMISDYLRTGIVAEKPENYNRYMRILLHCEDIQQEADIRLYDKHDAQLKYSIDTERFELEVEGLQEGRPSLLPLDYIYIRFLNNPDVNKTIEYEGLIYRIKSRSVEINMTPQFLDAYHSLTADEDDPNTLNLEKAEELRFGIRFSVNRKNLRLMHRALSQVEQRLKNINDSIESIIIPQKTWPADLAIKDPSVDIELINNNIASNCEQFTAVQNIVRGLSRPLPYIVFGPPGTGKTTTITEAILQVYKIIPESRILITAPSNSAVNVITEKVICGGIIPEHDIFRCYSMNCNKNKVSADLEKISNYNAKEDTCYEFDVETLLMFRIIACTLSILVTQGFKPDHFTHIFIDEAGHAMEPEALIPVAGLFKIYKPGQCGPAGCLVLSGDHMQLGPIIRSPIARMYAFGRSLLERLMDTSPYRRQKNNAFNPIFLTKLVKNFRSHEILLHLPNKLFYDDELKAHGDRSFTHAMINYKELPELGVPLIFHGVSGTELREGDNPSFYNPEEISVIENYVTQLLTEGKTYDGDGIREEDIGIISPYRRQVLKIRGVLAERGYTKVTIGSTEEFQGQERLIMLLSTVRSDAAQAFDSLKGQTLGFLRNEKRFNVATTRAKALLIIVGDPNVLKKDYCWRNLLYYCRDLNACRGVAWNTTKRLYEDLYQKIEALNLALGLEEFKGRSFACNGQVAITDMTLQEEPHWTNED